MAENVVINGVNYNSVPQVDIPKQGSGTATFYDTADADAAQGEVLNGKTYYAAGGKKSGSMANNGSTSGTINTKAGTVNIPAGYTSGGTVKIADAEQQKIIADNIRGGVMLLGQAGNANVVNTTIASGGAGASDIMSGKKAYVNGQLVDGSASVPQVSQDSTTKVLTIS